MSLDYVILGVLSERPHSGYDLKTRVFDGVLSPFWSADQAQIYRTLERLQTARYVSSVRRRQSGRPDRRIYDITHLGREVLAEWLAAPSAPPITRDPFLVQLFFGASLDDESLLGILEARRAEHEMRVEALQSTAASIASMHDLSPRASVLRQTALDGAVERERALMSWLDDCITAVREGALPGSQDPGVGQRLLFGGAEPA